MRGTDETLGTLDTFAVEIHRAEAVPREGDTVALQRDPTRDDPSAVRVIHGPGRTVGMLAHGTAEWLAPLMDRGWVELEASVRGRPDGLAAPLRITVRLTAKGRHILEVPEEPRTPAEELHATVLEHWPPTNAARRRALAGIRERVELGVEARVLPETRLLLAARPAGTRSRERNRSTPPADPPVEIARRILAGATVGEPVTSGNLALYPVTLPDHPEPEVVPFDLALEWGDVEITEVDRDGTVNELTVRNHGACAVLLPQGLVVVGGKQDRMIAVTTVVPPGETLTVPVSCVEAGRWSWEQGPMVSRRMAPPAVRRQTSPEAAAADRQAHVWEEVEVLYSLMDCDSDTESLDELYEQVDLDDVRELLGKLPPGVSGFAAAVGCEFLGCDLFGSPGLLEPLRERLVEAWAVEAELHEPESEDVPESGWIARILEEAAAALRPAEDPGDTGEARLVVEAREVQGSLLLHGGSLLQASLFPG